MKGLGQFRQFDWAGFSAGKAYQVVGVSDWLDRDTGKRLGKRVDERLTFKIEGSAAVDVAIGDTVIPVDAVARCYGEYSNQLSIVCKGVQIVQPQQAMPKVKG